MTDHPHVYFKATRAVLEWYIAQEAVSKNSQFASYKIFPIKFVCGDKQWVIEIEDIIELDHTIGKAAGLVLPPSDEDTQK